jgi:hypothetical protein
MNHSFTAYVCAFLSLVGVPGLFNRVADSDFSWLLRRQPGIDALQGDQRAACRMTTKKRQSSLRIKTVTSLAWVLSAAVLGTWLFVLPSASQGKITDQQWFAVASAVVFAWATLGRLGWADQSFKGETIYEELDSFIFWVLYWVGTVAGMGAVAASAV